MTEANYENAGIIAVIQLSTVTSDYIIDVFRLRNELRKTENNYLRDTFSNPGVTKIMHGCDNDLRYLIADLGWTTQTIFDTGQAFAFLQRILSPKQINLTEQKLTQSNKVDQQDLKQPLISDKKSKKSQDEQQSEHILLWKKQVNIMSLDKLSMILLGKEMDKFYQVADWRIRPLKKELLQYAREDSHYLISMYLIIITLINPLLFNNPRK